MNYPSLTDQPTSTPTHHTTTPHAPTTPVPSLTVPQMAVLDAHNKYQEFLRKYRDGFYEDDAYDDQSA